MAAARIVRIDRKYGVSGAGVDMLIERLRKIRALNSDPSVFNTDRYILKRSPFHKLSILTKL